jgi:dihydroorotate dehydrogenase electron transfer subunit
MPYREETRIIKSERLTDGVYELVLKTEHIADEAKPGQFVSVYSKDGARLLPRPISICGIDGDTIRLVYRTVGAGTVEFSELNAGETLNVQGPLGNGYDINASYAKKKAVIFGGGIGIPPMLELSKQLKCDKSIVLGYRDSDTFLADEFKQYGKLYIASEDGSVGAKGNVLDAVREYGITGEVFYACGPMPMLCAIKSYAAENNIECYISLEEKMACGIGACLACVCKTKNVDDHSKVNNTRICKEGPVFDAREVEI